MPFLYISRWIRKGPHDVIVECERLSLDITDRCSHESCQNTLEFRSRSGTMNSTVGSSTTSVMGSGLPSGKSHLLKKKVKQTHFVCKWKALWYLVNCLFLSTKLLFLQFDCSSRKWLYCACIGFLPKN